MEDEMKTTDIEASDVECIGCGRDVPTTEVCCTSATDEDGTHHDPVCKSCCGPHIVRMACVGGYERADCDH